MAGMTIDEAAQARKSQTLALVLAFPELIRLLFLPTAAAQLHLPSGIEQYLFPRVNER